MNNRLTAREREHLGRVKALPCSICDAPGPAWLAQPETRLGNQ